MALDGSDFFIGHELYVGRFLALLLRVELLEVHLLKAQAFLLPFETLSCQQEDDVVGLAVDLPGQSVPDDLEGVEAVELHLDVYLGPLLFEEGEEIFVAPLLFAELRAALDHPIVAAYHTGLLRLGPTADSPQFRHHMVPGL